MCVDPEVNKYAGWAYIGTVCSSNMKLRSLLSEWHYSDASSGVVRNEKKKSKIQPWWLGGRVVD